MQHPDPTTRNDPLMLTPKTSQIQAWIPIEKSFAVNSRQFPTLSLSPNFDPLQKPEAPKTPTKILPSLGLPQTFDPLQKNIPQKSSEILLKKSLYNG